MRVQHVAFVLEACFTRCAMNVPQEVSISVGVGSCPEPRMLVRAACEDKPAAAMAVARLRRSYYFSPCDDLAFVVEACSTRWAVNFSQGVRIG